MFIESLKSKEYCFMKVVQSLIVSDCNPPPVLSFEVKQSHLKNDDSRRSVFYLDIRHDVSLET